MAKQTQSQNLESKVEGQRSPEIVWAAQETRAQVETDFEEIYRSNGQLPEESVLLAGETVSASNREVPGHSEAWEEGSRLMPEVINVIDFRPKMLSYICDMNSFKNGRVTFDNERMTIEDLITHFAFNRLWTGSNWRPKNDYKATLNSVGFENFKVFILELKKLNLEYIEFKSNGKKIDGESKTYEEFLKIALDKLNNSNFIQNETNKLKRKAEKK